MPVADFEMCKKTFNFDSIMCMLSTLLYSCVEFSLHSSSCLCCGLLLESAGQFVNTSKCEPEMFIVSNFSILNLAATNCMAIDIICGVLTECSLWCAVVQGLHTVHRVVIMLFGQQYLLHAGMWGSAFGFQTIVGNVSSAGLAFCSQWEGAGNKEGNELGTFSV